GPVHAAVGRAVHVVDVAGGLGVGADEDRAVVVGAALDLAVTHEGAALQRDCAEPGGAVVGVHQGQVGVGGVEVVPGDIHAPVEGAGRVVVHPHRFAVVVGAVMHTGARGPGDTVG